MLWAFHIIDNVQYLELDASYKVVDLILHGIIFNSSIPFALSYLPAGNCSHVYRVLFKLS